MEVLRPSDHSKNLRTSSANQQQHVPSKKISITQKLEIINAVFGGLNKEQWDHIKAFLEAKESGLIERDQILSPHNTQNTNILNDHLRLIQPSLRGIGYEKIVGS